MAEAIGKVSAVGAGLTAVAVLVALGCGGDSASKAKLAEGVRSQVIEHEPCDATGNVQALDVNNDGKPDIRRVMKDGREVCRISDLNYDGKPDMFEYYDDKGQVRRRESDYDDNGVVNAIEHFEGGRLVRRDLDTTNQGLIDTWDFFDPATGAQTKRERDATGDGRVDQWWTFEGDKVTIAFDRNGDGQPDPEATMVMSGGAGGVLAPVASAPTSPPAETPPPAETGAPPASPAAPTLSMPSVNEPSPTEPSPTGAPETDAGVAGKPQRGAAKR